MRRLGICFLLVFCLYAPHASAQVFSFLRVGTDSFYIDDQSNKLLLRTFVMRKFNKFSLGQNGVVNNVSYRANDNYNIGFGAHYKWLGANISFAIPFVNSDDKRYGETKFFDLQSYLYLNNLAIDLFVLSYKGYYMANSHRLRTPPPDNDFLIRNDLYTGNYGVNLQYIFNSDKFSYRAAFLQNQRQLKSAGSLILGGGVHYTRVRADSAVIPDIRNDIFFDHSQFNKSAVFALAVNAGYAYTHVIWKDFFITGSLLVGTGANYVSLTTEATDSRYGTLQSQFHAIIRGGAGYNVKNYFIGLQYYNYISRNNTPIHAAWQQLQTGNIRLTYAQRFKLKKNTVKRLKEIEDRILPDL